MVVTLVTTTVASLVLLSIDSCKAHEWMNHTLIVLNCDKSGSLFCLSVVVIGCVIAALFFVLVISCVIITGVAVKGLRHLMNRYPIVDAVGGARNDTERSRHQEQLRQSQGAQLANTHHTQGGPQYDIVDNENGPAHYFQLESPAETESRALRTGLPSSKLPSQQDIGSVEHIQIVTYDELTGPGYPQGSAKQSKHSVTSLPPAPMPQYSSIKGEERLDQKIVDESLVIYSQPDMSKKRRKSQKEHKQQQERGEMEMPHSRTTESLLKINPQKGEELGGSDTVERERMILTKTPSPPPPLLPPKPGQNNVLLEDTSATETRDAGESVYAEASSKPLRADTSRMLQDSPFHHTSFSNIAMGPVSLSPHHHHLHSNDFLPQERMADDTQRYMATENAKRKAAPPPPPLPPQSSSSEHRQHYDMPIDLFLAYRDEGRGGSDTQATRL